MTKGHNQEQERKNNPAADKKLQKDTNENKHLSDQQKNKGPQGRHQQKDQSEGTKGQNAI